MQKTPSPPDDLGKIGRKTWKKFHEEYDLTAVQDIERTRLACKCLDDEAAHMETVTKEGRYVRDRWDQTREHPAAKAARDCRVLFCRIVRDMGIDLKDVTENRPPRLYG
jgi:phage terminase small subunit